MTHDTNRQVADAGLTMQHAQVEHMPVMAGLTTRTERIADLLEHIDVLARSVKGDGATLEIRLLTEGLERSAIAFRAVRWCVGTGCDFPAARGEFLCNGHQAILDAIAEDDARDTAESDRHDTANRSWM